MRLPFLNGQDLLPHGYFSFGLGFVRVPGKSVGSADERALVLAHGADWSAQPLTLHRRVGTSLLEDVPRWFSADYDHHAEIAIGDLTGSGFEDVVVAVMCSKDQHLEGGGVKVYYGGPEGISREPVWIVRGFSAFSLVLADFSGNGRLDIAVSSLWEGNTLARPTSRNGHVVKGLTRVLINTHTESTTEGLRAVFETYELRNEESKGCSTLCAADVDLNGKFDLICGSERVSILYDLTFDHETRTAYTDRVFSGAENYRFCFSLTAAMHPSRPHGQVVACADGLFTLKTDANERAGSVYIHAPDGEGVHAAIQRISLDPPAVPSALCLGHIREDAPLALVVGSLDASGHTQGIAPVLYFATDGSTPLFSQEPIRLKGAQLMAARAALGPLYATPNPTTTRFEVTHEDQRVFTFSRSPVFDISSVEVLENGSSERIERQRAFGPTRCFNSVNGSNWLSLSFTPPLGATVIAHHAEYPWLDLAVTSSAGFPPASPDVVYRGRPIG